MLSDRSSALLLLHHRHHVIVFGQNISISLLRFYFAQKWPRVRVRSQWTRRINFAMLISNPTNRNGFGEHNSSLTILPFSTLTGWWTVLTRCVALWVYLYQTVDSLYGGGTILQEDCIVQ